PGPNGGTSTYKFCFATVTVAPHHFATDDSHHIESGGPLIMLQSIVLPDGQSAWTFDYSQPDANGVNWGDLVKITTPFGGSISYTWATKVGCHLPYGPPGSNYRGVTQRTVNANDGTGAQTWNYSSTTVTDPLGNDTVHSFTDLNQSCSIYETQTQYYS